jgi:hypothetical protein
VGVTEITGREVSRSVLFRAADEGARVLIPTHWEARPERGAYERSLRDVRDGVGFGVEFLSAMRIIDRTRDARVASSSACAVEGSIQRDVHWTDCGADPDHLGCNAVPDWMGNLFRRAIYPPWDYGASFWAPCRDERAPGQVPVVRHTDDQHCRFEGARMPGVQ